jgi:alpha-galactosidase
MHSRSNTTGVLQPDPTTFPSGLRNLSDFLHGRGLLFGIYTA